MLLSKFSVEDPGPSVEMTVKQSGQKARFIIKESHTPEEYRAITGEEPKDENVLSDSQIIDIGKKDLVALIGYLQNLSYELA